ncbi:DUF502 domain-containing protein [Iocasia frigidifontis]|uniref:DUF502 domain-containing protein n=1 Tax=Iocasia fonsfrigidae TaxID=2682810 RepID=A0A8A7K855_9FIRM|nr:DUF502 domain-containing protein [Iocasia fonsfrigidae]QTL97973.1 DUF502 domain-containing protein [Iocasia fonsfrigidae]
MFKKIRNLFLTGMVVVLPLVVSSYIIYFLFSIIDTGTEPLIELIFGRDIPGVGIIFTFIIILLIGIIATNVIGKRIIQFGEKMLLKIPFFRNIYISIKKVMDAIFTRQHSSFKKPVLFEYPRKGLYQIGFLTKESSPYFDSITGEELYNVFLPTTPNPTSGMFVMVPKKDAIILELSIEEALKLIISGGILDPEIMSFAKAR